MNNVLKRVYSPAVEDYLRAIYQLTEDQAAAGCSDVPARVTTSSLAERLGVRPASVTAMLQKMAAADPPLVAYHKSYGATLTAEGLRVALGVVRNHRLLETYLHARFGFGWDEVHDEADRLEHAISDEVAGRMAAALDHPTHDPHGHAIPAADLSLEAAPVRPLADLPPGQSATVAYVRDDDAGLLRCLEAAGLQPGLRVEMVTPAGPAGPLWVRISDSTQASRLDPAAATAVFVNSPAE